MRVEPGRRSPPPPLSPVGKAALGAILAVATGSRVLLALYNRSANDDHVEVIQKIVAGLSPLVDDCWQCYQPKLYHQTVADLIRVLGLTDQIPQVLAAQFASCAAGVATLALLWAMARALPGSEVVRLTAFGLLALNPRLTAIGAQATNDAFAIALGAAATLALWRYLASERATDLVLVGLALVLMSLAKFQGVVFFAMVATILLVRIAVARADARGRLAAGLGCLVVAYCATTPFLGDYATHYRTKGDAFAANWERGPAPRWLEHTYYRSPGVRSIVDGYLTFRIADLVRQPYVEPGPAVIAPGTPRARFDPRFAEHRTSLWSQLYGRSQFAQFETSPPRWATRDPRILNTGRVLLVAGLVPLAILVAGAVLSGRDLVRGLRARGPRWLAEDDAWTLLALFGGSLAIVAQLAYLMRDYSSMKFIYVLPGAAAMLAVFMRGLGAVARRCARVRYGLHALVGYHVALMALYVVDVGWLLAQLGVGR